MAGNIERRVGSWVQLLSTELNALANGAGALQATGTNPAFDNTAAGNLFEKADFELDIASLGAANTVATTCDLYILPLSQAGGTTYVDGAGGASPVTNLSHYAGSFYVRAVSTAQNIALMDVPIPGEQFIVLLINNTGEAFGASGHTLKMRGQGTQYT